MTRSDRSFVMPWASQRAVAVGKTERHPDNDGGKRRLRFPANGADDERHADIDQELHAAADVPGIDMKATSGHFADFLQRRSAALLGHVARISESPKCLPAIQRREFTQTIPLTSSWQAAFRP
jgi:hypothetical protein